MQNINLVTMPETEETWTIEEFLERTEDSCRASAIDLHRKSLMVEEAVEEVLELVKNVSNRVDSIQVDTDVEGRLAHVTFFFF